MWSDWLVFCDYGFSVSALWCPFATPTIYLGFSYLLRGVSLHVCSSKAQLSAPYLGWGISPHGHPSWPWMWSSSSLSLLHPCSHHSLDVGLLLLAASPDLWHGVAHLSHHPWPRTWGSSSAAPVPTQPGTLGNYPWLWARGSSSWPCFCTVCCSQHASAWFAITLEK